MQQLGLCILVALATTAFADNPGDCLKENRSKYLSEDGGCLDVKAGYVWSMSAGSMSYDDAEAYCSFLEEGGHDDWELPTKRSMCSLSQGEGAREYLDFSLLDFFWTQNNSNSNLARAYNGTECEDATIDKSEKAAVVCVRQSFGCGKESEDFKTAHGGCQFRNGVIWSKVQTKKPVPSRDVFFVREVGARDAPDIDLTLCNSLSEGMRSDWYTPTTEELESIADPLLGPRHLYGYGDGFYWSTVKRAHVQRGLGYYSVAANLESGETINLNAFYQRYGYNPGWYHDDDNAAHVVCIRYEE